MNSGQEMAVTHALIRARVAVGELNTSRTSEDIERIRKGVEHELETAFRVLGLEWHDVAPAAGAEPARDRGGEQPDLFS